MQVHSVRPVALGASLLCAVLSAGITQPAVAAQQAREVAAAKWFNWIGDGPNLESLRGRALLVHFFRCEKPEIAGFFRLLKFHHDYKDKGLVILAVTPDSPAAVAAVLKDYPLPFPVGAGSDMAARWGIGDYGQVIVDPKGEIYYSSGTANGVWNGKLLKGIKGSKRLKEEAFLRCACEEASDRKVKKAVALMEDGDLAKSLAALEAIQGDTKNSEQVRDEATLFLERAEEHVATLMVQIDEALRRREVLLAEEAIEALTDELEDHPFGEAAVDLAEELSRDELHRAEIDAALEYGKLMDALYRRGWKKNAARFQKLVDEYPDTRAAEKVRKYWIGRLWTQP